MSPLWPSELASRYSEADLVGQFRLSSHSVEAPDGWETQRIGDWNLVFEPTLPVRRILGGGGAVGWLLGHVVGTDGRLVQDELAIPVGVVDNPEDFEVRLDDLVGAFIIMLVDTREPRIYLDPGGSMGVVYSPDQKIVASTALLIPPAESDDRLAFVRAPGLFEYDPHLHYGLTVRRSVYWLEPNHYLDLRRWEKIRHWPKTDVTPTGDLDAAVETVARRLGRSIGALAEAGPVQMSLTAGKDTRLLLACARDVVDGIEFVTYGIPDFDGRVDMGTARHLANRLHLRHRLVRVRRPSRGDVERFLYRTGGVAAEDARCQMGVKTLASLDDRKPLIDASGAEIDRLPSYIDILDESSRFTIEDLLALRGYPPWPDTVEHGRRWVERLPVSNPYTMFDLRALEMRFGGWSGFLGYGYPEAADYFFYPFADRRVLEALITLPPSVRRSDEVTRGVIASRWPELLEVPFNEPAFGWYGTYRRLRHQLRARIDSVGRRTRFG